MILLTRTVFTVIEFTAMLLFCLSLFRIYFRYSLHKVVGIAVVMSSISVYIRDYLELTDFSLIPVLVTGVVMITILFQLPIIFSFLVCVLGLLATATFEGLVIYLGSYYDVFTEQMLKASIIQFSIFELVNAAILLLVMYPIQRYKLGFHTTSNDALKAYNFWLSAILIIAIFTMQVALVKLSTIHIVIPIILGLILLTAVYLAYLHNKKLWKNRRERLSKQ